ncbi:hypothetical protein BGZ58_003394, partial [Dissophora ornata]
YKLKEAAIEDILFEAGKQMKDFHPIHSFMLGLSDKIARQLFSKEVWTETCCDLPLYLYETDDPSPFNVA